MKKRPYKNLWDATKVALTGKFIEIQVFAYPQESSLINNLTVHGKEVEKKEVGKKAKPQISRNMEITKRNLEIYLMEAKKTKHQ